MNSERKPEFKAFHLKGEVLEGLAAMGYRYPTPVQAQAIPAIMEGHDLLVQAKTGSGKTLAFGLPLLNRLDPHRPDCQVMIIAPTRELALQVAEEIGRAGTYCGVMIAAVFGGIPIKEHIVAAQWATILVGTPGRVRDLLERGHLRLDQVRAVVLDEADEMLDMGFKKDLEFILDAARNRQQTLLFSATFPREIIRIAKTYMRSPMKIEAAPGEQTPTSIRHMAVRTTQERKFDTLLDILRKEQPESAIVFCQTKTETPWLSRRLRQAGFAADALHGDMGQVERFKVLEAYKAGKVKFMIATEVAARGLDIAGVSHVINYSVPANPEVYVHRSGRTGRAGRSGVAITLVTPREERAFERIEQLIEASNAASAKEQAAPAPEQAIPASAPEPGGPVPKPRKPELPELPELPAATAEPAPRVKARPGRQKPQPRKGPTADEVVAYAQERLTDLIPMARHLLVQHATDPVTLVAALLAEHPLVNNHGEPEAAEAPVRQGRSRR